MTTPHVIGNKKLTFLVNTLLSLKIKDSQSGMWVLKRSMIKDLNLTEKSATLATEIKMKSLKDLEVEK